MVHNPSSPRISRYANTYCELSFEIFISRLCGVRMGSLLLHDIYSGPDPDVPLTASVTVSLSESFELCTAPSTIPPNQWFNHLW